MEQDLSSEDSQVLNEQDSEGPLLLQGVSKPLSLGDVLVAIPPRPVVDRLVSRYFNSMEPSVGKLAIP